MIFFPSLLIHVHSTRLAKVVVVVLDSEKVAGEVVFPGDMDVGRGVVGP
jgi:hypothetical protein